VRATPIPPLPAETGASETSIELETGCVPLRFVLHPRARRYILRLQPDGAARVTIPRYGSYTEARLFAERHRHWLQRQLQRLPLRLAQATEWQLGSEFLFLGQLTRIEPAPPPATGHVRVGTELVAVPQPAGNLRAAIERHFWALAARQLPTLVLAYAAAHRITVRRVTIRNQRSRWGSSSRRGTISLNWRLIQMPPFVRDYVILHELIHQKEMNHSSRFWSLLEQACPDCFNAERWLKAHSRWLR
jgi:predicted metal-dependent hydrolase